MEITSGNGIVTADRQPKPTLLELGYLQQSLQLAMERNGVQGRLEVRGERRYSIVSWDSVPHPPGGGTSRLPCVSAPRGNGLVISAGAASRI